jgi:phage tail-like protein
MSAARNDPFAAYNFIVEIDGIAKAGFSEVYGLAVEVEVVDYREGNEPSAAVRKLPGLVKYANITLKRGYTPDLALWKWMKSVVDGQAVRAGVAITLLNSQRQPAARWNVRQAWPCRYEGPSLNALGNDVAIETLELCHEGLERVE